MAGRFGISSNMLMFRYNLCVLIRRLKPVVDDNNENATCKITQLCRSEADLAANQTYQSNHQVLPTFYSFFT